MTIVRSPSSLLEDSGFPKTHPSRYLSVHSLCRLRKMQGALFVAGLRQDSSYNPAVSHLVTSLGFPTDSLCGQMLSQELCLADLEMFSGGFYDWLSFVLLIVEVAPTSGALLWITRDQGPGGTLQSSQTAGWEGC